MVVNTWGGRAEPPGLHVVRTDGSVKKVPVTNRVFPSNAFMGLMMVVGTEREITAPVENGGKMLR